MFLYLILSFGICFMLCAFTCGVKRSTIVGSTIVWLFANSVGYLHHLVDNPQVNLFGLVSSILVYVHYIVIVSLASVLGALALGLSRFGRISLVQKAYPRTWRTWLFGICTGILGLLIGFCFFAPRWGYETFGYISANQLSFMLNQDLTNSSSEINRSIVYAIIVPTFFLAIIAFLFGIAHKDLRIKPADSNIPIRRFKHLNLVYTVALFSALAGSIAQAFYLLPIWQVLANDLQTSNYLEKNYVRPSQTILQFPEQKRNLIHIYLESMENSYYSQTDGGYMNESLMPELARLSKEGISFSDTNNFGGPQQVPGTEHSVAAMVAMTAGTPMLNAGYRNGQRLSYPDFPTIGDLLEKQGYKNVFMLGSDKNWGGLGEYYRRHGNFEVSDLQTAYDAEFVEDGYKTRWGLEDEKLYEFAKIKLTQLGDANQPFYFVLENSDTHFPDGYYSPKYTNPPFKNHYSNAIYYSQQETVAFVRWIQKQPWAENTTIVLTGDHQSMEKNYFKNWDPKYNRTVVNLFLNSVHGNSVDTVLTQNRIYAPYDFFPTILSAIGVKIDGERLGLGTNLFSPQKTLIAEHGVKKVISELSMSSPFYDQHRETKAEKY